MAQWNGSPAFATKKQLVSSISGLYQDLQDLSGFNFQNLQVSTLTASEWVSTPILYVSDIIGANIDISGIQITKDGVFNAPIVSLSSLSFKGLDKLVDLDVSFDLGLGDALGGFLGGLGALVGGGLIAVGTGAGLTIQGAEQGIATMVAGRPQNFINNNVYETVNFTSQLQISTLGNDNPLYSSIFRTVSSVSPNTVPGPEEFVSTFFQPGTTCIRSVSDPFNLISGNSNLNTSTIQSFGQWVPLLDATVTGEDIFARNAQFSSLLIQNSNNPGITPVEIQSDNTNGFAQLLINTTNSFASGSFSNVINDLEISQSASNLGIVQTTKFPLDLNFISTPYNQYTSTIDNYLGPIYYINSFITSNLTTIPLFTYTGSIFGGADIAICEEDETAFLSTGIMDFVAQSSNIFIQWGLAVDNRNSTIGVGTSKRVTWDNTANTSNIEDIPTPTSTIVGGRNLGYALIPKPNELMVYVLNETPFFSPDPRGIAFNISSAVFGDDSVYKNQPGYDFQFNRNVFVKGTLEANTIIALSSIVSVSTFAQTLFSTNIIEAASGIFTSTQTTKAHMKEGYISCLKSSDNFTNDYITAKSRMRLAGFDTPMSLVVGTGSNVYDPSVRFDFNTSQFNNSFSIQAQPVNNTVAIFTQSNVEISNLAVGNLTAGTLVYSNAEAPYITTSTIEFGWTGSFSFGGPVDYALRQSLSTPVGTYWNNYIAASNQVLNIMNFSNQVNMLAQQFSTPLQYVNTEFGSENREGWASTIFYNAQTTPCRIYLAPNAGNGEVSLQAQTFNVLALMNQSQQAAGVGSNVGVPVGSTYKFTCDGTTWTTSCNAPTPGNVSYTNMLDMTLDFETLNLTTNDTLNLNAETINLNGQVVAPNLQLDNVYIDGFISTTALRVDSTNGNGVIGTTTYTGPYNSQPSIVPLNLNYTANTTDFLNGRDLLNPSRGANLFNSLNRNEWNNTVYRLDTTPSAGKPIVIVGEVLQFGTPLVPYPASQFWVNNAIDGTPLNTPVYQNIEGVLSNIGNISAGNYTRISTSNGISWAIQNGVPNPQGATSATYGNYYQVQMTSGLTTVNVGMPMVYNMPSLIYNTNKTLFYSPQIRVATIDAPTFNTREAGFENVFYYDANISFTKEGATSFWYSDAFNPILNYTSNSYYSIAGWQCFPSLTRVRISGNAVSGWDLDATAYPVGGGATDFVWGTARYLRLITDSLSPSGNLRESYLMIPNNYFNFYWQGQGPIVT